VTTPQLQALDTRIRGLELEMFGLVEQVRRAHEAVERQAHSLDDLEAALVEISITAAEQTEALISAGPSQALTAAEQREALTAAMTHREQHLPDAGAAPTTGAAGVAGASGGAGAGSSGEAPVGQVAGLELATLHAWVQAHIAPLVRKTTTTGEGGGIRWCRNWPAHHDAVERFTALYLAYQQLSADPAPVWRSVFLRDHLDPHLATLTSPYGPFYACTPRKHSDAVEPLGQLDAAAVPGPGSQP
jgi:hypothetical protein